MDSKKIIIEIDLRSSVDFEQQIMNGLIKAEKEILLKLAKITVAKDALERGRPEEVPPSIAVWLEEREKENEVSIKDAMKYPFPEYKWEIEISHINKCKF